MRRRFAKLTKPSSTVLSVGIEDFKEGMTKFAGMFTKNYGMRLVFRGNECYTNGRTIVCPDVSLLARANMTEAEVKEALDFLLVTRGYVYHEGGHVIDTDMSFFEKAARVSLNFKHLLNALEDCRIERRISKLYPGAREALIFTHAWVEERVAKKFAAMKAEEKPKRFVQTCYAIGQIGSIQPSDYHTRPLWKQLSKEARELATKFRASIIEARDAHTTAEAYAVAQRIWKLFKAEDDAEKKAREEEEAKAKASSKAAPEDDAEDGDEDAASGDGDGEAGDDELGDISDAADGDADSGDESLTTDDDAEGGGEPSDEDDDDDGAEDAKPGPAGSPGGDPDADDEDGDPGDVSDAESDEDVADDDGVPEEGLNLDDAAEEPGTLEEEMKEMVDDATKKMLATGERPYLILSTEHDVVGPPPAPRSDEQMTREKKYVNDMMEQVRFAFGPVERTLRALLKAQTMSYHVNNLEEGELDSDNLWRLAAGAKSPDPHMREASKMVFKERMQASDLTDTVCAITVDISGSMSGGGYGGSDAKDVLAQKSALVFAKALESVNIPFEVTAWSTSGAGHFASMSSADQEAARELYSRFHSLIFVEIKKFEEKWPQVYHRLHHMRARSCNYDGESVKMAAQRLLRRKEKRKILFVMSDGLPSGEWGDPHEQHVEYLHHVTKSIRDAKQIELIGIGIGAPEAAQFYKPNFVNVSKVQDLPGVVLAQMKQLLIVKSRS